MLTSMFALVAALSLALAGPAEAADFSVYPSPHAHFAAPGTQISFRGGTPAQIGKVTVTGSRSGRHSGRLEAHSDGHGASFLPKRPFEPGERVRVRTRMHIAGAHSGDYAFTIGHPVQVSVSPQPPQRGGALQNFASRPDLRPPAVKISTRAPGTAPGLIFAAPKGGSAKPGAMIFDDAGRLVWFHPIPSHEQASDFRVQTYRGKPVLTWWQGHLRIGDGYGHGEIWSDAYHRVARVRAANGLSADLHEFTITPRDTALVTVYRRERRDLRRYGGIRDGVVVDSIVQEIDIRTGLLLFEWNSLDHVSPSESYVRAPHRHLEWDYFHVNSIDEEPGGDLIVSGRNTSGVYRIGRATGAVVWRLGGKRSDFKLGPGVRTAWQHNVRVQPDGTLTIFDNGAGGPGQIFRKHSRAVTVRLDTTHHTATLLDAFTSPRGLLAPSQGNVERLPNGNDFVGWGSQRYFDEFGPAGQVLLDGRLSTGNTTYRTFRYPWAGRPTDRPRIAVRRSGSQAVVSASWNGATGVATWQLLAGSGADTMQPVATTPDAGFETTVSAAVSAPNVEMRALDAAGHVLGTSARTKVPG